MGSGNGLWVLGVGLGQSRFDQALQPGSLHFGGGANQDLMPSQVLRRSQFALKADLSEEPATKGRPKGEAKAKAKGKAKSRAKSAASKKGMAPGSGPLGRVTVLHIMLVKHAAKTAAQSLLAQAQGLH